jgi:hypothetical protein
MIFTSFITASFYTVPADRKTAIRSDDEQTGRREVLFKIGYLFGRGVLLE